MLINNNIEIHTIEYKLLHLLRIGIKNQVIHCYSVVPITQNMYNNYYYKRYIGHTVISLIDEKVGIDRVHCSIFINNFHSFRFFSLKF